jgi:hypothetical protein
VRPRCEAGCEPWDGFSEIESFATTTESTFILDPGPAFEIYLARGKRFAYKCSPGGGVMKAKLVFGTILGVLLVGHVGVSSGQGFDQQDRDRLIRLETTLQVFMEQMDKRLQQLDKRIDDLRQEMNSRLEEMREDTNKRFEQVDKRIDQLITFLWILAGIFTALVVAVIAFAYWDRRTIIRRAKEEALKEMEEAGRWKTILEALRQVAIKDSNVAEALRRFNLL